MKDLLHKFLKLNFRSVFLNFYLLPFSQAVRLPLLFARNVKISAIYRGGVQLNSKNIAPAMVQIGYGVCGILDEKHERSIIEIGRNGKLIFDGNCILGSGIRLGVYGKLKFGHHTSISGNTSICCYKRIEFGDDSRISWDCLFLDTDFHKIYADRKQTNADMPVSVGKNVWIGCRSTVLKGSVIPDSSVVGAGSLVCKKFDRENSVYGGSPAKLLKENIRWEE